MRKETYSPLPGSYLNTLGSVANLVRSLIRMTRNTAFGVGGRQKETRVAGYLKGENSSQTALLLLY